MVCPKPISLWFAIAFLLLSVFASNQLCAWQAHTGSGNLIDWNPQIIESFQSGTPWQPGPDILGGESLEDYQKQKATLEVLEEQRKKFEKVAAAAKEIGLDGKWIVLKVEFDGKLSLAQIGQKANDVISIAPGADNGGPLVFG